MKLYTNTMPFAEMGFEGEPELLPVGTTFAAIGVDDNGVLLKRLIKAGSKEDDAIPHCISIDLLDFAFKEVCQLDRVTLTTQVK